MGIVRIVVLYVGIGLITSSGIDPQKWSPWVLILALACANMWTFAVRVEKDFERLQKRLDEIEWTFAQRKRKTSSD